MRIAVCQYTDHATAGQLEVTESRHAESCQRFDYEYVVRREPIWPGHHPYWQKSLMLLELIRSGQFDQLVWLDTDAFWLGQQPLTPQFEMLGAVHHWHFEPERDHHNVGVLFVNARHPEVEGFFERWTHTPDDGHPWHDQHAFNKLQRANPEIVTTIGYEWNSMVLHPSYRFQGVPVIAAWHGSQNRVEVMRNYIDGDDYLKGTVESILADWGNRAQLVRVIEILKARAVVEVGVYLGEFLQTLQSARSNCKFYGVDAWLAYPDWSDKLNEGQERMDSVFEVARKRFRHSERVKLLRQQSTETRGVPQVDLAYIDANHGYSHAAADIRVWWDRVRPGGVLAGHDYVEQLGTKRAVDEFASQHGLRLFLTRDEEWPSWAFVKPSESAFVGTQYAASSI